MPFFTYLCQIWALFTLFSSDFLQIFLILPVILPLLTKIPVRGSYRIKKNCHPWFLNQAVLPSVDLKVRSTMNLKWMSSWFLNTNILQRFGYNDFIMHSMLYQMIRNLAMVTTKSRQHVGTVSASVKWPKIPYSFCCKLNRANCR